MSSIQVYNNRHFKVYITDKGDFILHNSHKPFKKGHTHLKSFSTAKYLAYLAINRKVPYHLSRYLLISLIRVSDSSEYSDRVREKLEEVSCMPCGTGSKKGRSSKKKKTRK